MTLFHLLKFLDFSKKLISVFLSLTPVCPLTPPCSFGLAIKCREISSECVELMSGLVTIATFLCQNWLGYTKKRAPIGFHRVVEILHRNNAPVQVRAPEENWGQDPLGHSLQPFTGQ